MTDDGAGVTWSGRQAVVSFPEEVSGPDVIRIGEQLLQVLSQGAVVLIVDMSATMRCDRAAVDALERAYLHTAAGQVELRLVISAPNVRSLISAEGLDRLVPVYASLKAALAEAAPDGPVAGGLSRHLALGSWGSTRPATSPEAGSSVDEAVLRQLVDALDDGIALVGGDGRIVLANRRLTAMFGYQPTDLAGQDVEILIPPGLREAHRSHRAAYERKPTARPMADRARLAGVRGDGSTVPVTITLAPVPADGGHLVLAVVRDATHAQQRDDLAILLGAITAREADRTRELLDRVVAGLFQAGLSLQASASLPVEVARERISDALQRLDDTIHEIRDHILRSGPPDTGP